MRGLERGLERVFGEIRTVANVEVEAFCAWNLVKQMEQGVLAPSPVFTDVKTFVPIAHHFRGKVHIITGGYPCQPFSNAGKRKGADDPRHLWPFIKEIIRSVEPVACFFENVPGHLSLGYEQVRRELCQLGYEVKEGIFSAEEIGATHERKRLFILALAHSYCNGSGTVFRGLSEKGFSAEGEEQRQERDEVFRQRVRDEFRDCGKEMGHSESSERELSINSRRRGIGFTDTGIELDNSFQSRLEGHTGIESGEERREKPNGSITPTSFPMGQGYEQYPWEPPRTIPRMGCMLNGYSFRVDLLRMAGNAVVEQTAELAFRTLIQKFNQPYIKL